MARIRWLTTLLALPVLIGGCQSTSTPVPDLPTTSSGPIGFCVELGGSWNNPKRRCTLTGDTDHTHISVTYPVAMLDDPTAGPVLKTFVKEFVHQHSTTDGDGGESTATLKQSVFSHDPDTKSVVFTADWYVESAAHPNAEFTTFTFDMAQQRQLELADLFCPGVDPLQVLPPIIRPAIEQKLGDGPPAVDDFEPGKTSADYADDYRAWALDGDDLVLYLPAARTGPVPAGLIQPRVPLTELRPHLRAGGCST